MLCYRFQENLGAHHVDTDSNEDVFVFALFAFLEIPVASCVDSAIEDLVGNAVEDPNSIVERTEWMRANGRRGFLKSAGIQQNEDCYKRFDQLLSALT